MALNKAARFILLQFGAFLCVDFSFRTTSFYVSIIENGINDAEFFWFFPVIPAMFLLPVILPTSFLEGCCWTLFLRHCRRHEPFLLIFSLLFVGIGIEEIYWIYGLGMTPLPILHFICCTVLNAFFTIFMLMLLKIVKR